METRAQRATAAAQNQSVEEKIQQLRELFADAPEVGRTALKNVLGELTSQVSSPPPAVESAGRAGRAVLLAVAGRGAPNTAAVRGDRAAARDAVGAGGIAAPSLLPTVRPVLR